MRCRRPRRRNRINLWAKKVCASTAGVPPPRDSTTPHWKRIPAASASSPTSRARNRARSSPTRSTFCAISSIAARSAPIRVPATAPVFWCRFRTPSSCARPARSASSYRSPATTRSAHCSCRRKRRGAKSSRASSPTRSRPSNWCCSAGATCRPTIPRSAKPSSRPSPPTCRCSSAAAITSRATTNSSAGSTSCASRFRRRSTCAATAASPAIIRCRCRAALSSTRACSSPTSWPNTIPI